MAKGLPLPPEIKGAPPVLMTGLELYLDAFLTLLPFRGDGIRLTDVEAYVRMFDVPTSALDGLLIHIKELEAEYMEYEKNRPEPTNAGKSDLDALMAKRKAEGRIR